MIGDRRVGVEEKEKEHTRSGQVRWKLFSVAKEKVFVVGSVPRSVCLAEERENRKTSVRNCNARSRESLSRSLVYMASLRRTVLASDNLTYQHIPYILFHDCDRNRSRTSLLASTK